VKTLFSAASAALICASLAISTANAQSPQGANAPQFGIAVVNMNEIFLQHTQFKSQMDQLK